MEGFKGIPQSVKRKHGFVFAETIERYFHPRDFQPQIGNLIMHNGYVCQILTVKPSKHDFQFLEIIKVSI